MMIAALQPGPLAPRPRSRFRRASRQAGSPGRAGRRAAASVRRRVPPCERVTQSADRWDEAVLGPDRSDRPVSVESQFTLDVQRSTAAVLACAFCKGSVKHGDGAAFALRVTTRDVCCPGTVSGATRRRFHFDVEFAPMTRKFLLTSALAVMALTFSTDAEAGRCRVRRCRHRHHHCCPAPTCAAPCGPTCAAPCGGYDQCGGGCGATAPSCCAPADGSMTPAAPSEAPPPPMEPAA